MSNAVTLLCRRLPLPPTQKAVLMCLADYCHDTGKDWHSIASIMEWTCLGKTTVIDALKGLEACGLLIVERSFGRKSVNLLQLDRIRTQAEQIERDEEQNRNATRTGAAPVPVRLADPTGAPPAPPPVRLADEPVRAAHPKHEKHQEASMKQRERTRKAPKTSIPDGFAVSPSVRVWAEQKGFANV